MIPEQYAHYMHLFYRDFCSKLILVLLLFIFYVILLLYSKNWLQVPHMSHLPVNLQSFHLWHICNQWVSHHILYIMCSYIYYPAPKFLCLVLVAFLSSNRKLIKYIAGHHLILHSTNYLCNLQFFLISNTKKCFRSLR